jgi:hypothetical protein
MRNEITSPVQEEIRMKRTTTRWTTALAAAALLGLPTAGWTQTATPPPQQPTTATAPQAAAQPDSAEEHLRQAKTALNEIPAASLTGKTKSQIADLKKHLAAIERASSTPAATPAAAAKPGTAAPASGKWATEVAAMDKILTQLLDTTGTVGAGTTGTTGTAGATTAPSKAAPAVTLDDATRAKLTEVRTHLTNYAMAMSGTPSAPDVKAPAKSPDSAATPATDPAVTAAQPSTTTAQPAAAAPATAQPAATSVDKEAMRRHLTEGRETLSQLTQLSGAAQLTGEPRNQVSQLIVNFNELITTQTDWKASYAKVTANLNALIGPADPAVAVPTTAAATPGAVGTSGTTAVTIDATVRAKLLELRGHLNAFEKAAGGASATVPTTPPAMAPASAATAAAMSSAATTASSTAGTAGSVTATAAPPTAQATTPTSSVMSKDDVLIHIQAMEAIIGPDTSAPTPAATGTAGTTGTVAPAAGFKPLDRAQIDQLRKHLAELRKIVDKK